MRILRSVLATLLLLPSLVIAAGNSLIQYQRCPDDTCTNGWLLGPPAVDSVYIYNKVTDKPELFTLPSAMAVSSGALVFNGTTSQYVRGDGVLTAFPGSSQSSTSRSLNSAYQISTTRNALVFYSVQCTITASIAGGQNCDVILEIASDSGFTTNVQTLSVSGTGQTYTLAVALQGVQPQTGVVSGFIPASFYTRIRTVQNTGAPTFSYRFGQEVLL
jgi:hypothetical protein